MVEDVLEPGPAARAGAAWGQLATRLPGGGLLISSARLVEFNCRAAILIAACRASQTERSEFLRGCVEDGIRIAVDGMEQG